MPKGRGFLVRRPLLSLIAKATGFTAHLVILLLENGGFFKPPPKMVISLPSVSE
jgi:hypothetical protein